MEFGEGPNNESDVPDHPTGVEGYRRRANDARAERGLPPINADLSIEAYCRYQQRLEQGLASGMRRSGDRTEAAAADKRASAWGALVQRIRNHGEK